MELIATKLEPPDHVVTWLNEHMPFYNLNRQNGISIEIEMGYKVLENQISILEVKDPDVAIGLTNIDLIGLGHSGANGIDALG